MLIDTHSHLNFKAYNEDREEVIKRTLAEDVWLINVGSNYKTSLKAVQISDEHQEKIYSAIGLHPVHVNDEGFDEAKYLELAKNDKVVAIGETGLDYFHIKDTESQEKEKELFQKHLKLAQKIKKPLIIHCRKAYNDLLEEVSSGGQSSGVIHSFMGRWSQAEQFLKMGFYLGFNGVVTYSRDYDKVIKNTPLDRILIETDCPYLTPIPHRGERNEPGYVKYVAEKIAEIKEIKVDELIKQVNNNAKKLFQIK